MGMAKLETKKITEDMIENASKITIKYDAPMYRGEGMKVYFIDFVKNVDVWEKESSLITGTHVSPKRYEGQLNRKIIDGILSYNGKNVEYCTNVRFIVELRNNMKGCKTTTKKPARKPVKKTVRRA